MIKRHRKELRLVRASTSWRATAFLRKGARAFPRLARASRRFVKLAWWTVTFQLLSRLGGVRARRRTALERLLHLFHDSSAIPAMQAMYDMLARYSDREVSHADLTGALEIQSLISEMTQLARARGTPSRFDATVIIPVHNKLIYTMCCLKSVLMASTLSSFEIIVADDASTDATPDVIPAIGGVVRHRRNPENLGFIRTCNSAVASAQGEIVVLLNNDTIPLPGWLDELVATLRADASIGLAGSKLLNADGTLQEAGGVVWSDGSAWNFGRGQDATAPQYNYLKDADYVSGSSIALPKLVWDKLGGFDELFVPAYCEDTDLAFRVRASGLRCVYQPFSAVVHHEGITHGRDLTTGIKAYQVRNTRRFVERWKATLAAEHFHSGECVPLARDRSRGCPRILFVDHYIPQPDRDAGSRSVYDHLLLFKAAGFHVMLWPQNMHFDRPYTVPLQRCGIEVLYDLASRTQFQDWIRVQGPHLDYAYLSRPSVAVEFIDVIRRESKAKILFYGHDIHFRRMANEFELTGQLALKAEMAESEKLERTMWSKSDIIYYPSQEECDTVRAAEPNKPVRVIPLLIYKSEQIRRSRERILASGIPRTNLLLFVGGFRHRPNVDAMLWFVREVWPRILRSVPDCRLCIAGSFPPAEIEALATPSIRVTGFVTHEELEAVYRSAQVAIVPLRFGGGVKGKIIEALAHGTPVVTTSTGAQGLPKMREVVDVCDSPGEFAASVIDILRNPLTRLDRALAGLEFVEHAASEATARKVLAFDVPELRHMRGGASGQENERLALVSDD